MSRYGGTIVIQSWTTTVGALRAEGAQVQAYCSSCSTTRPVDLDRIIAAKGALYSLWNRTTPCRTPGCSGRVWFRASRPGSNTWATQLREAPPEIVAPLHEEWNASRKVLAGNGEAGKP